jgi:hypothetical protein
MKKKNMTIAHIIMGIVCLTSFLSHNAEAQPTESYYGQTAVGLNKNTKAPRNPSSDAFGSELFIDGRTDVALDARSQAADLLIEKGRAAERQRELDRSIRADIASGQPVTVLIAPEHFVQLTFLRNNEIVYPKRAFSGQPDLLIIDKKDNSPYVYIAATAMVEGQSTNMFIETEEDGRIQTYVINLLVTEPKNIREQVSVNLVDDKTPPIRGGEGSEADWDSKMGYGVLGGGGPGMGGTTNVGQPGGAQASQGLSGTQMNMVSGKFKEEDVRKYLNTMIEMAEHYPKAKQVERKTGRIIYRDADMKAFPGGRNTYVDPVEGTMWNVKQAWFFPKYDAILLDVRVKNPSGKTSMWDFSQMRWQANNSPRSFSSTAAAPIAMQTLPRRTNQIWYLIQGNRLDPQAEFSPVFPRAEKRGTTPIGGTSEQSK